MVDSDTLRKSNFYTDVVTEAYSNGEGEAVSVSTIDKRVISASGWISCKCNIDESMGVKIISPEGVKRVKNIEELEDSTMAFYIDFRNSEILFTKDLLGKTIYYEYYGTGVDRLCVNRIYTDLDNYGNILMTLEDMTNDYVQILKCLEGIENLDTKLNELKLSIKSSDISIDELAESILVANTSKTNLDKTINESNKKTNELNTINSLSNSLNKSLTEQNDKAENVTIPKIEELIDSSNEKINYLDGEDGLIKSAETKITTLNEKINLSIEHENTLDSKISEALSHEETLGNSTDGLIKKASDGCNSLQLKINDATIKENELQETIDDSINKKTSLNELNTIVTETTIPTLNQGKLDCEETIVTMSSKKEEASIIIDNLNKSIEDGDINNIINITNETFKANLNNEITKIGDIKTCLMTDVNNVKAKYGGNSWKNLGSLTIGTSDVYFWIRQS